MAPGPPFLLALAGADVEDVRARIAARTPGSDLDRHGGLEGLAARLADELPTDRPVRCAVIAATAEEARTGLGEAAGALGGRGLAATRHAFVGAGRDLHIGLLFPGQGAPVRTGAGGIGDRVAEAREAVARAKLPSEVSEVAPEQVQLAVIASSLAALAALRALGIEGEVATGHSLGELTALHWAGALDADALLRLAAARGAAMSGDAIEPGAMATALADERTLNELTRGRDVAVACLNSPCQRVVSGTVDAVEAFLERARAASVRAMRLDVVGAFHSPLMRPAVVRFERCLEAERLARPCRRVVSTVTGAELDPTTDLKALLARQILDPVRFSAAATVLAAETDLVLEVGAGRILTRLMAEIGGPPAVSMRAGERSAAGLIEACAAAFAAGAPVAMKRLVRSGAAV